MDKIVESFLNWLDIIRNPEWLKAYALYFVIAIIAILLIVWIIWYFSSRRRRSHFKFHWHHFTYVIGLRNIISRHYIGRVHVHECYDPLVDFLPHSHIFFNKETLEDPNLIRKKVLLKLYRLADNLPDGVNLLIFKTFSSRSKLSEQWNKTIANIRRENPDIGLHEAMKIAKFETENPRENMGGHETGGAVDVALCNDKGEMFDFGTQFHEFNNKTFTSNPNITKEQKKNRKRLVKLMKRRGFVNFPGEWWHFSYGDRSWAAYKGKRNGGIFGAAESDIEGVYNFTIPVHRTVHDTHK